METVVQTSKSKRIQRKKTFNKMKEQKYLYLMVLPALIWVVMFSYTPMYGIYMAFVDYLPKINTSFFSSLFHSKFVGFKWFNYFFSSGDFWLIMRNTLATSFLTLMISFPAPIILAITINEVGNVIFKKVVQTASYLPYFISWVIAANIIVTMLSGDGVLNHILMALHLTDHKVLFLQEGKYFWWIIALSNTWKGMGYNSIIYLAAIAGINPELYEAAKVDGASRWQQIKSITLPSLKPTVVVLLVLSIGGILEAGFDQQYLLQNSLVMKYSDVIDTYTFRYGLQKGMFSYGTAVGLFKSSISFALVVIVNKLAKKLNDQSILF